MHMCEHTDTKILDMCGHTDTNILDMCGHTDTKFLDMCGHYDNTSNYGKKNDVMESCPEFNAE